MLKGKVVFITGAAKRLGLELALGFSKAKASIALHYHQSEKEVTKLKLKLPSCDIFKADLNHVLEIEEMVSNIMKRFGQIDILINNAAIFYPTPFEEITEKTWDHFLNVNLKAPFFCTQAVARYNKKFKVINIADSGTPKTRSRYIPYWISKAAIVNMTEILAKTLGPDIQVNCISPGHIAFDNKEDGIPSKDIVSQALSLASQTSITGNNMIIDRGRRYS